MTISPVKPESRLGIGFWVLLAAMLAAAVLAAFQISKTLDIADRIAEISQRHDLAVQWRVDTRLNLTRTLAIAKSGNLQALADYLKPQMTETSARIAERQKFLQQAAKDAADKARMATVTERRSAYIAMRDSIFAQMQTGDVRGGSSRVETALIPAVRSYMDSITAVEQSLHEQVQNAVPLQESNNWATRVWIAVAAVSVLVALAQTFIALRRAFSKRTSR